MDIIKSSLIYRFFAFVISCVLNSVVGSTVVNFFKKSEHSVVCNAFRKFFSNTYSISESVYAKVMGFFGKVAETVCRPFKRARKSSFCCKILNWFDNLFGNSKCLSWLSGDMVRKIAIIMLASYILLDFVFRSIIKIDFLASV